MIPWHMKASVRSSRRRGIAPLAGLLALATTLALAQNGGFQYTGSVIGDEVMYSIGGGNAVSMSGAAGMRSIGVGAGWNSNLICGDMSLSTTIQNQLNGVTSGFQNIMSSVIQSATGAVASLPALLIQRADPGLYNLLTNGVLQARLDFVRSRLTCRAMAERMADVAGDQLGWSQLAEGMALRTAVASSDAASAVEQAEKSRGNQGVPWVGGGNAGGAGQAPVKVVGDVTRAGCNLVNDAQPPSHPTGCETSLFGTAGFAVIKCGLDGFQDTGRPVFVFELRVLLLELSGDFPAVLLDGADDAIRVRIRHLDDFLESLQRKLEDHQDLGFFSHLLPDRVCDDASGIQHVLGEVRVTPGESRIDVVVEDEIAWRTVLIGHQFAKAVGGRIPAHERTGEHLQCSVVARAELGRTRNGSRHGQDHAFRHGLVPYECVVDQEPVDAAVAVAHRVDVDETERQHRGARRDSAPRVACSKSFRPASIGARSSKCGAM